MEPKTNYNFTANDEMENYFFEENDNASFDDEESEIFMTPWKKSTGSTDSGEESKSPNQYLITFLQETNFFGQDHEPMSLLINEKKLEVQQKLFEIEEQFQKLQNENNELKLQLELQKSEILKLKTNNEKIVNQYANLKTQLEAMFRNFVNVFNTLKS
jgi:hypothetical protein